MCYGYRKRYICNYTGSAKSIEAWLHPQYDEFVDDADKEEIVEEKFKGATVIDPKTGFYRRPVIVVDFQAKYPTEMKSHNLCSSTYIGNERMVLELEPWLKDVPHEEWPSPKNIQFDTSTQFRTFWLLKQDTRFQNPNDEWHDIRPYILKVINGNNEWSYFTTTFPSVSSEIITHLFDERAKLKKAMKQAKVDKNKLAEMIANADQMAVKVIMNSLYGMFGASPETGRLPCRRVSMSVTSIGREEIAICKQVAEEKFHLKVIYGDTDSLFVSEQDFKSISTEEDIRRSFTIGEQFAEYITNIAFNKKAVLNLEKTFFPFVLPMKKQYYGAKYEPDKDKDGKFVVGKPKQSGTGTLTNKLDFCDVHKEIFQTMFQYMIMENNIQKAYQHLVLSLERMANMWYPIEKFACRNKLGSNDNPNIKAVRVRDKVRARMPGSEPRPGDIVSFVYVRVSNPNASILQKVEETEYAQQTAAVLDLGHYILLLRSQVEPYFVRFPSLQVPNLFDKAISVAAQYGSQGFMSTFSRAEPKSRFSEFMKELVRQHLRKLTLPDEQIDIILQVWTAHFQWLTIPAPFYRSQATNAVLFEELDREMEKPDTIVELSNEKSGKTRKRKVS